MISIQSFKFRFFFFLFSFFLLATLQHQLKRLIVKPPLIISKQDALLNLNENILKLTSMGQKRFLSSLLWTHTLMESDIEHYRNNDLNSWMYLRFNTITELDPYFYDAYLVGGKYLSVVKDDILGAREIFEKGLIYYPSDFWLRFYNGFNYFFELDDIKKALENYEVAIQDPSVHQYTPYLPSMVAKIQAEDGRIEAAYTILYHSYLSEPEDSPLRLSRENTLYALKAEIDLDCLNQQLSRCDHLDFRGRPYLRNTKGQYYAADEWTQARPSNKGRHRQESNSNENTTP